MRLNLAVIQALMVNNLLFVGPDNQIVPQLRQPEILPQLPCPVASAGAGRQHFDDKERVRHCHGVVGKPVAEMHDGIRFVVAVVYLDRDSVYV
jgi:hypothetical protein